MNLPSGLLDLLVISGLFSQKNTPEAAATIRNTASETLNLIDKKNHQYLGKILAIYLDEKALLANWFQQEYWKLPLSRERYPNVTTVSVVFDDWFTHLDKLERLVLRYCILEGFKGPFKDPDNPTHYRDDAAKAQLLEKFHKLTDKSDLPLSTGPKNGTAL